MRKRHFNFELNLIPFIDVLSTCICFLLVTAVFINLGTLQVSQAVGSEKTSESEAPRGSIIASLGQKGDVRFEVKDVPGLAKTESLVTISGGKNGVNFVRTAEWIKTFSTRHPKVKTVLILPQPRSKYDDLIQLMAQFKKTSIDQIGIAPL